VSARTNFDLIFASVPVDRVAVRVTYQPKEEAEEPLLVREEVPAPVVRPGVTVTIFSSGNRRQRLKERVRALEYKLRNAGQLPEEEWRALKAERYACSRELSLWRQGSGAS
jgi:hypothetical protein